MRLVIDMPEELMKVIDDIKNESSINQEIYKVISNGTVIPAGHGRIVDGDVILIWLIYKGVIDKLKCGEIASVYKEATIIEADTEK